MASVMQCTEINDGREGGTSATWTHKMVSTRIFRMEIVNKMVPEKQEFFNGRDRDAQVYDG